MFICCLETLNLIDACKFMNVSKQSFLLSKEDVKA